MRSPRCQGSPTWGWVLPDGPTGYTAHPTHPGGAGACRSWSPVEAVGCGLSQLRAPSMFWEFLVGQPGGRSRLPFRCAQAFQHPLPSAFPIPVDAPSPHGHQGASGPPPHHLLTTPGPGCPASPVRQLRPPHGSLQAAHPQLDEAPPGSPLFLKPSLPPGAPEGATWPTMSHTYPWLCVPDTTLFLPPGSLCLEGIPQPPPGFPKLGRSPHPMQDRRHSAAAPGCPPHPLQPASFPPQPTSRPCRAVPSTGNPHSPLGRDDSHSTWSPTTTSSQKPSSHVPTWSAAVLGPRWRAMAGAQRPHQSHSHPRPARRPAPECSDR